MIPQRFSRMRLRALGHRLWRASDDQAATLMSPFRAKVEHPTSAFDDIEVVFDDKDGI